MKTNRWVYYITTSLLTLMIGGGAAMYIFNTEEVVQNFNALHFPTWLIYPMAIAKILALVAIWTNFSKVLKEWAYAGLTFNLLLAIGAHLHVQDGEFVGALIGFVLVMVSSIFWRRMQNA